MGRVTGKAPYSAKTMPELSVIQIEVWMPSDRLWELVAMPQLTQAEHEELDRLLAEREAECERMGL